MAKITELCSYFQVLDDTKRTNISAALAKLVCNLASLVYRDFFFPDPWESSLILIQDHILHLEVNFT